MPEKNIIIPRPEHPEPMMRRASWQSLNGQWLFELDSGASGEARGMHKTDASNLYSKEITVPFCPESSLSGIGITDFMTSVWYKRKINLTEETLSGRVLLHFGAVDFESKIYVNGVLAAEHFGGYSSFTVDITDFVKNGENDITVNAKDDIKSQAQPSGKQSSQYGSWGCFYTRTTGIWQTVWLEFVPKAYIKAAKYFPNINDGSVDIELTLSQGGNVTAEAFFEGRPMGKASVKVCSTAANIHLKLAEKHLWDLGKGNLYDLKFAFESDLGADVLESYFGLREVGLDGFKFMLNGRSVFQRTVLDQGFYPDGICTAPNEAALIADIEMSMALGFNGARLHEKIFEPRFLYHCDRLGYLVWGEHANWGLNASGADACLNFLPEWAEAVKRDFNHPSIIGWCPFNEVWGNGHKEIPNSQSAIRMFRAVYDITKTIDPTRPVIDVSGGFHETGDIYDQHDYNQDPQKLREHYWNYDGTRSSINHAFTNVQKFIPNLPLFISEFGGIGWIREQDRSGAADNAWGYGEGPKTEEEFFARYEGLCSALLENPNLMGFCYTQLYDVEQEINGLYTYGRENKFADYSRIIRANTQKAAIED